MEGSMGVFGKSKKNQVLEGLGFDPEFGARV